MMRQSGRKGRNARGFCTRRDMKILHVILTLDPQDGGVPIVAYRLASAQAALGHEVHILCYTRPGADERMSIEFSNVPHANLLHIHRVADLNRFEKVAAWSARKPLKELISRTDVVHLHSVWEPLLYFASHIARKHRKPYFVLLSGMLDPWALSQKRWKKKAAIFLTHRRMFDHASSLHVLSPREEERILPLGLRAPRTLIPNGIFLEELEPLPPRDEFHGMHPELKGAPYILFLSRLHLQKGLDYLAEGFALLARENPTIRLVIAGPDFGSQAQITRQANRLGVGDRVHFVGAVYGREKLAVLSGATCFALTSRQEGFSVAVIEALAAGLPVIISPACNFPEVVAEGAGIVAELDARQIADALGRICGDPALRDRMSRSAYELVKARFTWQFIADRTIALYRTYAPASD